MKQAPGYAEFYRRSMEDREAFWTEQAALVDWNQPFDRVCNHDNPPFARWFEGGKINLCHNAVDRHLQSRADQNALIFVSTETDTERTYSFRELHAEVAAQLAAVLRVQGVKKGDRVLIYMPMIPEAAFCHAGLRAHRCHPLGGVWWLRQSLAGQPHRGRLAGGHRQRRRGFAWWQGGRIQAAAGRSHPPFQPQTRFCDSGEPRPRCDESRARPRSRLCGVARAAPQRRGGLRMARCHGHQLHHLHQRHHRQTQGRTARHRLATPWPWRPA